ncbi:vWA domain-containing protein [Corynebacterium aquatimens]|uniref:VWFA domain-containing protein n=1 Tax=Corynebacterium aquatimens TaxID=1190508 RepID=A0A931DYV9_9CORY|nr:vWA domain-containing protein [Corynebacterium aquatimens]MBG6121564.1 hypothetical protein [Corynebacterium aquatimens]WJY65896.1 hypothetical protein CAQUA_05945 [Corynebacterium aquatimens]
MGRHSSQKQNYSLSKGLIALIAALVLIMALIAAAKSGVFGGDANPQAKDNCVSGDLALPVAAADHKVARTLIDDYAKSNPVVRDYCVQPVVVDTLAEAAAFVGPDVAVGHQEVEAAGRSTTVGELQPALSAQVGLAGAERANPRDVELSSVVFPVNDEPEASAVIASQLAQNERAAVKALTDQRIPGLAEAQPVATQFIATSEMASPEGFTFNPLDGVSVIYSIYPLNATENISEDQSRAAQDFARFSADRFDGKADSQPVIPDLVWAAARPAGGENITGGEDGMNDDRSTHDAQAQTMDTLFVVDTSDGVAANYNALAGLVSDAATKITESGHQVGLWNFSSPLNPGVTQGWRNNVALTPDASQVAATVSAFNTAGAPQTREAVLAATQYAVGVGTPVRIIVLTSGSADTQAIDDATLLDALKTARAASAVIDVFRVGDPVPGAVPDQALYDAADNTGGPNLTWSEQLGTFKNK